MVLVVLFKPHCGATSKRKLMHTVYCHTGNISATEDFVYGDATGTLNIKWHYILYLFECVSRVLHCTRPFRRRIFPIRLNHSRHWLINTQTNTFWASSVDFSLSSRTCSLSSETSLMIVLRICRSLIRQRIAPQDVNPRPHQQHVEATCWIRHVDATCRTLLRHVECCRSTCCRFWQHVERFFHFDMSKQIEHVQFLSTCRTSNATSCLLLRHVACCRSTCCFDMLLVWTWLKWTLQKYLA